MFVPKTNPISPCDSPVTSPVIKKQEVVEETKILSPMSSVQLPSLTSALQSTPMNSVKLNPITPTVSLDYFDTYKPNDENWRFELMDSITKSSKQYNLDRYNYLNRQESHPSLSRYSSSYKISKPSFNSKISPKILHPQQFPSQSYQQQLQLQYQYLSHPRKSYSEKKIKFPYESNYTYLNKTYLTDVAKYPEYLELAESLILLSQLDQSLYVYSPTQEAKPQPILQTIHTSPVLSASTTAPKFHLPQISSIITSPTSIASSHQTAVSPILSALAAPNQHQHQHPTPNPNNHHNHHNHQQQHQQHYQPHYHQTQAYNPYLSYEVPSTPQVQHKSIPLTPPSTKSKSRSEMIKSPPKSSQNSTRVCISCGSDQSPCWRPSWSIKEGQLCNSCGLRYKKTAARCLNKECKKIPAKGEWSLMQSKGKSTFDDGNEGYGCLDCGHRVEVKK